MYQNVQFFQPLKITFMMTCGFIDMNTYILTEGNHFKTFLKELALDSYYVIEHEIGQVYGVCTH